MPSPYDDIIGRDLQDWRREIEERQIHQSIFTNRHAASDPATPPVVRIDTTQITPGPFKNISTPTYVEQPFPSGCCGDFHLLRSISSIQFDVALTLSCSDSPSFPCSYVYSDSDTWVVTTDDPPPTNTFLFRCSQSAPGFPSLPEFRAGVTVPFGYGFGEGVTIWRSVVLPWNEIALDINLSDCNNFSFYPRFTTAVAGPHCLSPFGHLPSAPIIVPIATLISGSPFSYSYPVTCSNGSYEIDWTITFS